MTSAGEPIALRVLAAGDAVPFRELRLRALQEDGGAFLSTFEDERPRSVEDFAKRLAATSDAAVIGAFLAERLVGMIGYFRHSARKERHRASLWGMYVVPEARRRRLGDALLREGLAAVRTLTGVERVELSVLGEGRAARALYVGAGFVSQARISRAVQVDDAFFDEELFALPLAPQPTTRSPLSASDEAQVEALASRAPSDCVPLLLELARRQASRRRPKDVQSQFRRDPFVAPSPIPLRAQHRLDQLALEAASEFDAILLSPLAPLGTCAAVAPSSQNRIVSTVRMTEVVSDPTNVLALECARRLQAAPAETVRLCTLHQTVRAQKFVPAPGFTQHFRMFALVEAGRALPEHRFEIDAIVRQLRVFWLLLDACEQRGARIANRRARIFTTDQTRIVGSRLRERLAATLPRLVCEEATLASNYYDGVRVCLDADDQDGRATNLADVARFDWAAQLGSDRRLRLIASGLGIQRLATGFGVLA